MQPPVLPASAPFSALQRAWLNGYLAGLCATQPGPAPLPAEQAAVAAPRRALTILFGTQTGTAQALAKRFATAFGKAGYAAVARGLHELPVAELPALGDLLLITSTYGDGEMPENAHEFWARLQDPAAPRLTSLRYAVLGLGDSNYSQFCQAAKDLDRRLAELGARPLVARVDCDVEYQEPAQAWFEAVSAALAGVPADLPLEPAAVVAAAMAEGDALLAAAAQLTYSRKHPFPARLLRNSVLNAAGSEKETRHFEISLEGSGLSYEAGDALGVMPSNCPVVVRELLDCLGFDGEEEMVLDDGARLPLQRALGQLDLRKPSSALLRFAADELGDSELKALLDPARREELRQVLWGREAIDFLLEAKGRVTPADLSRVLRRLQPRLYSISSSPKAHPGEVHLTVSVLRHQNHGRARKGVCSTFLADRCASQPAPVFVQQAAAFRLPADPTRSVLMVGPGTGVAPFRAFLEERRAVAAPGKNWLFFGEQRAATDFYYQDELLGLQRDGYLTHLSTAFSRDQPTKVYVQHRLLAQGAEVWAWLQEGAHFYVCGDASRMAKDVDAALHQIAQVHGGLPVEAAQDYFTELRKAKRYQRDVY